MATAVIATGVTVAPGAHHKNEIKRHIMYIPLDGRDNHPPEQPTQMHATLTWACAAVSSEAGFNTFMLRW